MVWLPCHLIVNTASCLEICFFFCPSEPNIEEGETRKEKDRQRRNMSVGKVWVKEPLCVMASAKC